MSRTIVLSFFSLIFAASLAFAQSQPGQTQGPQSSAAAQADAKPQTPRQALIEIINSKDASTVLKHLPEATKEMLRKSGGPNFLLADFNGGLREMVASGGGKLDIPEAGPTLLSAEDPRTQSRAEVTIESDDYRGDEDDMELALHEYKNGEEQFFPQLGRILLNLKLEKNVWKVAELGYTIRLKLDDAKFLDSLSKEVDQMTASSRQTQIQFALQSADQAEAVYLRKHGAYSCSLQELSANAKTSGLGLTPDLAADMLKRNDYKLTLSDCTASGFKASAEPVAEAASETGSASSLSGATTGTGAPSAGLKKRALRTYCSDQTGSIRFSSDGSAQTCFSNGKSISEEQRGASGIGVELPSR